MKLQAFATLAAASALGTAASLQGNTPLLVNTDLASTEDWIAGSNLFVGGAWQAFIGSPGGDFTVESRITRNADSITFNSYDDGESDRIESYLFQEFNAGPATSPTPTIFNTGDVIVFKGTASATTAGGDPSDVIVRAFVKTLGYNELGWENQTKDEYSAFQPLTTTDTTFELSITYPDITVDTSLQVIQVGFEITTEYDGTNMDSGTITFKDLEAYVQGDEVAMWLGYEVVDGNANTDTFLGWVEVSEAPYIWSYSMNKYLYIPATEPSDGGEWIFINK